MLSRFPKNSAFRIISSRMPNASDREDESFEDLLTDLEQSRKTIEKEREEVASYRREMERLQSELKNQQEKLDTQRDRIIREANARATDIVQEAKDLLMRQ